MDVADGYGDRLLRRDRWLLDGLRAAPGARLEGGDDAVVLLPQLQQFTGECRVRRVELKQLNGAWTDAIAELVPRNAAADAGDYWDGVAAYLRGTSTGSRGGPSRPRTASPRLPAGCRPAAWACAAALGSRERAGGRLDVPSVPG